MNNLRRKTIQRIYDAISAAQSELETVLDDEREAFENIPESFEGTDRYETAEEAVENLESAYDAVDELLELLENAMA